MKHNKVTRVRSEKQYEPRIVGEILQDYLENSNEPLAVAYRERINEAEEQDGNDHLFKDFYPDTHPGIDLKLITHKPGHMPVGAYFDGAITRDGEDHFSFIQNDDEKKKMVVTPRNPHIYLGKRINVNQKENGMLYPTFNRPHYTKDFSFQDFCREAAEELLIVAGLVEDKPVEE